MMNLHRDSQKRIYEEGAEYFITTVTSDWHPFFEDPILAELFVRDLHFAKTSAGDDVYHRLQWSVVLTNLHERFIESHGFHHNFPKFKWQSSFRDHIIRDEDDYLNHLEYIHNNPIKHGLVSKPEDYLFSWICGMEQPFAPD